VASDCVEILRQNDLGRPVSGLRAFAEGVEVMWRMTGKVALLAGFICAAISAPGHAQSPQYPTRLITLVVPFVPGGATDTIARIVAQHLGKELGQSVIVDNRPAASGTVGTGAVAKSPPDGYTLLLGSADTITINPHLHKKLSFDSLTDLAPIALVADAPELIVVSASLPASNLREFIELARAKAGGFNYGSPGVGTIPHLAGARFARMIGTQMVHVPFRGSAAAMTEIAAGDVQMTVSTKASADSFAQAGKVKLLAIASPRRLDSLPDVPTTAEAGLPGYEISNWWGVLAPQGTSPDIIALLNSSLRKMFDDPANAALLTRQGILPVKSSAQEFAERIRLDHQRWKEIVAESGVQLD
jgi:tripartite-type tricarboxylate transporter receptor subunit TctC